MRTLYLNGKFLSAPLTGVHRVAEETIRALDEALPRTGRRAVLLRPRDAHRRLPLNWIEDRTVGLTTWQVWEQAELPFFAADGFLLNLCNLGPLLSREAATMIHDAQVRETPESYSPAFRSFYRLIQPLIARRHRAILTVSDHARGDLIRHGVAPDEAVHVSHNGADHALRDVDPRAPARYGLSPGRYVLAQGSRQAHKNLDVLIEAFRRPETRGLELALFGDAPEISAPWLRRLGRVPDRALFGLMRHAALFACPSRTEGFGLPPLEAMAQGAPVLAAPCGAMPEVLGDAALYAGPDDPAAWARIIRDIASDEDLSARLSSAGRTRAGRFRWADAAARVIALVDALEVEAAPWPA